MHFFDLPTLLRPGDCLVLNDSRVLPARLLGHREPTGGAVEVLLLIDRGDKVWECLVRPGRKLKPGTRLSFGDGSLKAEVVEVCEGGNRLVRFEYEGIFLETLERLGKMPLPPYIKAELSDPERYQTVYSREVGSAAAPTAGLHFTRALLEQVQEMGVKVCYVTLHVGLGTFRPVKEEEITDHEMHSEYCMISAETAETINRTKREGGRVICVGTTSCRTIESWAAEDGTLKECAGWTNIFIYPGYRFKALDCLITVSYTHLDVYKRQAEGVVGQTDELVVVLGVGTQPADAHGHAALGHPVQPGLGAVRLLKVVQELLGGRGQGLSLIHI